MTIDRHLFSAECQLVLFAAQRTSFSLVPPLFVSLRPAFLAILLMGDVCIHYVLQRSCHTIFRHVTQQRYSISRCSPSRFFSSPCFSDHFFLSPAFFRTFFSLSPCLQILLIIHLATMIINVNRGRARGESERER